MRTCLPVCIGPRLYRALSVPFGSGRTPLSWEEAWSNEEMRQVRQGEGSCSGLPGVLRLLGFVIGGAGPAMRYSQTPCACDTMIRGRAGASLPKVEVRKTVRRNRRIPPPVPARPQMKSYAFRGRAESPDWVIIEAHVRRRASPLQGVPGGAPGAEYQDPRRKASGRAAAAVRLSAAARAARVGLGAFAAARHRRGRLKRS